MIDEELEQELPTTDQRLPAVRYYALLVFLLLSVTVLVASAIIAVLL